jgi:hypothetical protein
MGALEQSRLSRAAASAKAAGRASSSGGLGGLKLKDYLGQMKAVADVALNQLDLVTGGMDPAMLIAEAREAGNNARASEVQSAYQRAMDAQNEYMNTVRTIGGIDPMAAEEDDTNIDAQDE